MTSERADRDAETVDRAAAPSFGFRAHHHLWALFDGTPAHAPPGRLVRNESGRIACHLCGKWFTQLGRHVRTHGWTAARYRQAVGLAPTDSLVGTQARTPAPRIWEVWQKPRRDRSARGSG